jgi:hypothetical protein
MCHHQIGPLNTVVFPYARHPIKHCTNLTTNTDRCIFAEIRGHMHGPTGNGELLVGGIYHHSLDNDGFDDILEAIEAARTTGLPLLLLGDWNAHHHHWHSHHNPADDNQAGIDIITLSDIP